MISINSVSDPFYNTLSNNYIDVTLNTKEYGIIPCTLGYDDLTSYSIFNQNTNSYVDITNQQLFFNAANGIYGNVGSFILDIPTAKQATYDQITQICDYVTTQIIPSQTKQLAYQNALIMLNVNGDIAPTTNTFTNLALTWGMTPNNFCTLILSMQQMSMNLGILELETQNQINSVNTANQLTTIINNFNTVIANTVTQINAVVPIPISMPNSISVKGVTF